MNVKALELAQEFEYSAAAYGLKSEAAAELRRLHEYEIGYEEWSDKTNWMVSTYQINELGMHRADILKKRIDRLNEVNQALVEALEDMLGWGTLAPKNVITQAQAALAKAKEST